MGKMYKALQVRNDRKVREVVAFVDSGCDKTIISDRIGRLLEIEQFGAEEIKVANAEIIVAGLGHVTVISINDDIKAEMEVGISDIPFKADLNESLHDSSGMTGSDPSYPDENIDMIIGVDFLQEHNIKLIFEK